MKLKNRQEILGSSTTIDLPEFGRPKFADTIHFPADITELTSQNVSELLGKYTALLSYVTQEHAKAVIAILKIECSRDHLESRIFIESPRIAHIERWKRDQVVESDPRMFDLKVKLLEAKQKREIVWAYVQNYERFVSALSRELSRKMAIGDGYNKYEKGR